jgi:hypothetical protein
MLLMIRSSSYCWRIRGCFITITRITARHNCQQKEVAREQIAEAFHEGKGKSIKFSLKARVSSAFKPQSYKLLLENKSKVFDIFS